MKASFRNVFFIGSIAVILLLISNLIVFAAGPVIAVNPTSGQAGSSVTVTGNGWTPNLASPPYQIRWGSQGGTILGSFTPNANGFWTATITIPGNASPGDYTIFACSRCDGKPIWASTGFKVTTKIIVPPMKTLIIPQFPTTTFTSRPPTRTPTRTATPEPPTECDQTGMAGEIIIDFEDFPIGTNLKNITLPEGVIFMNEQSVTIVDPGVGTRSESRALKAGGMIEFGSAGIPVHLTFTGLQEFVGVYVGLDEPADFDAPFTASMKAYGRTESGMRYFAGEDTVTLGPGPMPVKKCLSVSDPAIYEVYIDYLGVGNLELIDNITLRGPKIREEVPQDTFPPFVYILTPEDDEIISKDEPVNVTGEIFDNGEIERVEFWVNGRLLLESGATPLGTGDDTDGRKKFGFLWNGIPLSELKPCDRNVLQVKAFDAEGNWGQDTVYFYLRIGDLSISNVEPVQVVFGAPLVKGKGTAFRVNVVSTFKCNFDVKFRLSLPADQWDISALGSATSARAHGAPMGWTLPEITLPFTLPKGKENVEVMLPVVPQGLEDAAWDATTNPSGLIGFIRQVPRPIADSVGFEVEIDPQGEIVEKDETNNIFSSTNHPVVTTRPFKVVFVPWMFNLLKQPWDDTSMYRWYLNEKGYADASERESEAKHSLRMGRVPLRVALSDEEIDRLKVNADAFGALLLGGFPIADTKYRYSFNPFYIYFREDYYDFIHYANMCETTRFATDVRNLIISANPTVDYVILELPTGCCGRSGDRASYVDGGMGLPTGNDWLHYCQYPPPTKTPGAPTSTPWPFPFTGAGVDTVLHESNHVWNHAPDCYGCENYDPNRTLDCSTCLTDADGFWVNGWQAFEEGGEYFMWYVNAHDIRWWRLDSTASLSGTELGDGYENLVNSFTDAADPQALLVHGSITRDNQANLLPFNILENAYLDFQPGSTGDYYFVLKDSAGAELSRTGFTPVFTVSDSLSRSVEELDVVHFSYRIGWDPDATTFELQDKNGSLLAERVISASSPLVSIVRPESDTMVPVDEEFKVQWSAEDTDGDDLLAAVHISTDGGATWYPAASEIEGNEFDLLATAFLPGEEVQIRVMVTDGVRTGSAIAAGKLIIGQQVKEKKTAQLLLIVYYAVAIIVIGVIIWWLLRKRK